ncbi:angiopoietin-related protein 2-like [Oratosquilla oratoria]|uniref:angiopoietin-related protein 2-like n=1 Tax=Oratosquilla oratoria TaxID=337810 RepID=UPI003F772516
MTQRRTTMKGRLQTTVTPGVLLVFFVAIALWAPTGAQNSNSPIDLFAGAPAPNPWTIIRGIVSEEVAKLMPALGQLKAMNQELRQEVQSLKLLHEGAGSLQSQQQTNEEESAPASGPSPPSTPFQPPSETLKPQDIAANLDDLKNFVETEMNKTRQGILEIISYVSVSIGVLLENQERMFASCTAPKKSTLALKEEEVGQPVPNVLKVGTSSGSVEDITTSLNEMISALGSVLEPFANLTSISSVNTSSFEPPKDCKAALDRGFSLTGVYTIQHGKLDTQEVYCDQERDGGGWTVILARSVSHVPPVDFNRTWKEYERGFGNASAEYWIGLKTLREMSIAGPLRLRVDVRRKGESATSYYDEFSIGSSHRAGSGYRLNVAGFDRERSTAGDALQYHHAMQFSTFDHDNDKADGGSCSLWSGSGGWWYNYCFLTNPTGRHPTPEDDLSAKLDHLMEWREWKGERHYLDEIYMSVRPRA